MLLENDLPPHVLASVQRIRMAATHGSGFLDILLSCTRGNLPAAAATNIDRLIRKIEPVLLCLLQQKTQFKMELHAEGSHVLINPIFLEQVILNLILNARDAVHQSGEIRVRTCNLTIAAGQQEISRLRNGDYVLLEVSDTGCGMDIQTGLQIFEPFFSTKQKGEGSGLGLTIVNGIVTQSAGEVQVTSAPGKGTTVRVFLPLKPAFQHAERGHQSIQKPDEPSPASSRQFPAMWSPDQRSLCCPECLP
jgi:signal transduction histidine kinase